MRRVKIGNLVLGKGKVYIESMLKVKTSLYRRAITQGRKLQRCGCDILRLAVKDKEDIGSLARLRSNLHMPLIGDVHFDYRLALGALEVLDAVRINPLNITSKKRLKEVANQASLYRRCLRIGVNSGSVRNSTNRVRQMFKAVEWGVKILEDAHFFDIMISAKSSSARENADINEILRKRFPYPLHIGFTASGPGISARVKSSIAIGYLLLKGIGETVRVSLTDSAATEIELTKYILQAVGAGQFFPEIISCPTCGRTHPGFLEIVEKAQDIVKDTKVRKPLRIAIMGCEVNGPGEAGNSDLGFCFSCRYGVFFKAGRVVKRFRRENFYKVLEKEVK